MTNTMTIRPTIFDDLDDIGDILDGIELFPSEMLGDMIAPFLGDGEDLWLSAQATDGAVVGFCFCRAEEMTNGTWNMLAIGVSPDHQGGGAGAALVNGAAAALGVVGARLMIVDTSSGEGYAGARKFYAGLGFEEEARIRDFWDAGDDKITFRKLI